MLLFSVSEQVNLAHRGLDFWRDESTAIKLLAPLSHALLSLPDLTSSGDSRDVSVLFEITRRTCLVLVGRLKTLYSFHASELAALQTNLVCTLESSETTWITCLPELALWSLVSVALAMDQSYMAVLSTSIQNAMSTCCIESAAEAIQRAAEVIWIEPVVRESVKPLIYEIEKSTDVIKARATLYTATTKSNSDQLR